MQTLNFRTLNDGRSTRQVTNIPVPPLPTVIVDHLPVRKYFACRLKEIPFNPYAPPASVCFSSLEKVQRAECEISLKPLAYWLERDQLSSDIAATALWRLVLHGPDKVAALAAGEILLKSSSPEAQKTLEALGISKTDVKEWRRSIIKEKIRSDWHWFVTATCMASTFILGAINPVYAFTPFVLSINFLLVSVINSLDRGHVYDPTAYLLARVMTKIL